MSTVMAPKEKSREQATAVAPEAANASRPRGQYDDILALQRGIGNRAVNRLIQGNLRISQPRDAYEREADAVACLQEPAGGLPAKVEAVVRSGGGQPLDPDTRAYMESRLGTDFGDVRVHNDAQARACMASLGVRALTHGNHVAFGTNGFAPYTLEGKRLLAHELAHVVQQSRGGEPPGLDPTAPHERAARDAADAVAASEGAVAVEGATSVGLAADREADRIVLTPSIVLTSSDLDVSAMPPIRDVATEQKLENVMREVWAGSASLGPDSPSGRAFFEGFTALYNMYSSTGEPSNLQGWRLPWDSQLSGIGLSQEKIDRIRSTVASYDEMLRIQYRFGFLTRYAWEATTFAVFENPAEIAVMEKGAANTVEASAIASRLARRAKIEVSPAQAEILAEIAAEGSTEAAMLAPTAAKEATVAVRPTHGLGGSLPIAPSPGNPTAMVSSKGGVAVGGLRIASSRELIAVPESLPPRAVPSPLKDVAIGPERPTELPGFAPKETTEKVIPQGSFSHKPFSNEIPQLPGEAISPAPAPAQASQKIAVGEHSGLPLSARPAPHLPVSLPPSAPRIPAVMPPAPGAEPVREPVESTEPTGPAKLPGAAEGPALFPGPGSAEESFELTAGLHRLDKMSKSKQSQVWIDAYARYKEGRHVLLIDLNGESVLLSVSGSGAAAGHTEYAVLEYLLEHKMLKRGDWLLFQGLYAPCPFHSEKCGMCSDVINLVSRLLYVDVIYDTTALRLDLKDAELDLMIAERASGVPRTKREYWRSVILEEEAEKVNRNMRISFAGKGLYRKTTEDFRPLPKKESPSLVKIRKLIEEVL